MRLINKSKPIPEFENFLKSNPQCWDSDFHDNNRFPGLSKKCRETILVFEQDCQSGYTEMPLNEYSKTHIDHYKKKGMSCFRGLMFDWNNFIVDSIDTNYGACYKDKKINDANIYNKIFNPTIDSVEHFFFYNGDGEIIPTSGLSESEEDKVNKTIEIFNLNHRTLKNKRRDLLIIIEDYESLNDDEVKSALSKYGFKSVIDQKLKERQQLKQIENS